MRVELDFPKFGDRIVGAWQRSMWSTKRILSPFCVDVENLAGSSPCLRGFLIPKDSCKNHLNRRVHLVWDA
jgi:hypothetical protein